MLVAIAKNTHIKKVAKYAVKEEGPFMCVSCNQEVLLKKGVGGTQFFAHKISATCSYGKKEKELHRRAKMEIFDALVEKGYPTELEHTFTTPSGCTHLIDVLVHLPQGKVAVVLDKVGMSLSELYTFTQDCQQQHIAVLWGCMIKGSNINDRYLPYPVEKFSHTLLQGTVYYWTGGMQFTACHFAPYRPKNKAVERTYGKYVLRQLHHDKIPLDTLEVIWAKHKKLGELSCPVLLPADWHCGKD